MAELRKILSYPANDIDKILQQGVYSVADDTERLALASAIKTTNRTVYVRSTGIFYAWDGTIWEQLSAPIDTEMSDSSTNAVQNKVIKEYIDEGLDGKQDRDLFFTNIQVNQWLSDNTYQDFPYKAYIQLQGVVPTMFPYVIFNMTDAASGNYGAVSESTVGGIYLWSKVNTPIVVPAVVLSKTVDLEMSYQPNAAGGYTLTITDADTSLEKNPAGGYTLVVEE